MGEYKKVLGAMAGLLKAEGFANKGDTFFLLRESNWGVINFQKSKDSSSATTKFTINLGVFSTALGKALGGSSNDRPAIEDCHWKKRAGFLLPQKRDYWWIVGDDNAPTEIISEISTLLKKTVIPDLKSHITDDKLKQEWLSGISEGLTEFQRYIYLTTLLKLSNDERLGAVVESFMSSSEGKSYEYSAKEHLKGLGLH